MIEHAEDVCYYCGEPFIEGEPCEDNLEKGVHESQREVDEIMNELARRRQESLDDLGRKVAALQSTSTGEKL
jgi:hypothetical protein